MTQAPEAATSDTNNRWNPDKISNQNFADIMTTYWNNYYPFDLIEQMITSTEPSSTEPSPLRFREIAIVLSKRLTGDNIFTRHNCIDKNLGDSAFKQLVCAKTNTNAVPSRIELGAIYSGPVQKVKTTFGNDKPVPVARELVFDFDLTDFDIIRTCCHDKQICSKCFKYLIFALELISTSLKEHFGFKKMLPVFSGRRGAHLWVLDEEARWLPQDVRGAIAEFYRIKFAPDLGDDLMRYPIDLNDKWHALVLEKSKDFLDDIWTEQYAENWSKIVYFVPKSYYFANEVDRRQLFINSKPKSWAEACSILRANKNSDVSEAAFKSMLNTLSVFLTYPRIDINVTKIINHLLKAPFCVHPGTGWMSVPLDLNNIASFNPLDYKAAALTSGDPETVRKFQESIEIAKQIIQ